MVCDGHGVVELGERGTAFFDPTIVSTAIALALEAQARLIHDDHARSHDPAPALRGTLELLAKAGLIAPKRPAPQPAGPTGTHPGPAAQIVARATGITPTRTDQLMIRARPYPFQLTDRPGELGVPVFSNNWHPSSLAVLLDPMPFETTTAQQVFARRRRVFHAQALATAATTPRRKKQKR